MKNTACVLFASALLTTSALLPVTPAMAMTDSEFAALRAEMAHMAQRLAALEGQQADLKAENDRLKTENAALREDFKAVASAAPLPAPTSAPRKTDGLTVPGTDTTLKLGGYIKVDAIHDINTRRTGNAEDFAVFATIPLDGSVEESKGNHTRLHARQTRLNLTSTTPTPKGDLKLFVEGDFFGSQGSQVTSNAADFVLRQAYGEIGSFLAGQTWSNYVDLAAWPETLDYAGSVGVPLVRQAQFRYTFAPENSKNRYSLSLENPETDFTVAGGGVAVTNIDTLPDFTAKAVFGHEKGHVAIKGVARQLKVRENAAPNATDSQLGYVLGASGVLKTIGKDDLRFNIAYGEGAGRYILDLALGAQGAGISAPEDVHAIKGYGGYAAYRHWWTDTARSNFIVGYVGADNPSFLPDTLNKTIWSGQANLIWSVLPKVDIGAEYTYGYRKNEAGDSGDLHRVQMSAKYSF